MSISLPLQSERLPVVAQVHWTRALSVEPDDAAYLVGVWVVQGPSLVWEPLSGIRGIMTMPLHQLVQ